MALLCNCRKCNEPFSQNADSYETLCDECNGKNQQKRDEEARYQALTLEKKVEELRKEIELLRQEISYRDARF